MCPICKDAPNIFTDATPASVTNGHLAVAEVPTPLSKDVCLPGIPKSTDRLANAGEKADRFTKLYAAMEGHGKVDKAGATQVMTLVAAEEFMTLIGQRYTRDPQVSAAARGIFFHGDGSVRGVPRQLVPLMRAIFRPTAFYPFALGTPQPTCDAIAAYLEHLEHLADSKLPPDLVASLFKYAPLVLKLHMDTESAKEMRGWARPFLQDMCACATALLAKIESMQSQVKLPPRRQFTLLEGLRRGIVSVGCVDEEDTEELYRSHVHVGAKGCKLTKAQAKTFKQMLYVGSCQHSVIYWMALRTGPENLSVYLNMLRRHRKSAYLQQLSCTLFERCTPTHTNSLCAVSRRSCVRRL